MIGEAHAQSRDLIVLGAGAGGMSAALTGALEGLRVTLVESAPVVGGTSATSSGTVWIPDNPYMSKLGMTGDADKAAQYLDALVGNQADRALREKFLVSGPRMVAYFEKHLGPQFRPYERQPDYRQALPGAEKGGRPLEPLPFDGRQLGKECFAHVRFPLPELMLPGGLMVTRGEAARLLRGPGSWDAIRLAATLFSRLLTDRVRYPRGTRLVLGNALVARLYKGLLDRGVEVRLGTRTTKLLMENGAVVGVAIEKDGKTEHLRSRGGVVLAGGGFPADPEWRARFLPSPTPQYTAASPACKGETMRLALEIGAAMGASTGDNALWFPSSVATRSDGSTAVYPHIVLDRAKPGLIAVTAAGRRFVDEAVSYHDFTHAMYESHRATPTIPAMLVCDRRFIWKYGLGMIWPHTPSLRKFVRQGYLLTGRSLAELAERAGIDPAGLAETVEQHNGYAATGVDLEFHKGENPYDRSNGDASHGPNPCIGPVSTPPYYAVRVYPTPLATSLGLRTDSNANVLDTDGKPIAGLHACGTDMSSAFGNQYPGAGAQLGPAMTFGYVAALHVAGRLKDSHGPMPAAA